MDWSTLSTTICTMGRSISALGTRLTGRSKRQQYPVEMMEVRTLNNGTNGHINIGFEGDSPTTVDINGTNNLSRNDGAAAQVTQNGGPQPTDVDPNDPDRPQWDNQIEFLMSCIAMSVGLGNIWRFPYIAYKNGGGAFLIPYLIVLTFIGRPIYFLELAIGQFSSKGQVKVWHLAPFFKGVGYASMIGTICLVSYYASLMSLTVFYFFASFQGTLPWSECQEAWVSLGCDKDANLYCNSSDPSNAYLSVEPFEKSNCSISQLYFENEVLHQKRQIDDGIGAPEWRLSLCLLFAWLCMWASLIKGVSSSGKVAYFTALFPYVVLGIMLIRGVTLPGAGEGILYFITPQWEKMKDPQVWYEAVSQCFFSLSTGFGPIIMFASYNPLRHNIYRDAWIISGLDTFTSLLAGVTIFAILGNLAHELNLGIDDVASKGPGLAFVSYPSAIARFDWAPQLFAVLFYAMLFTLGVGSATSLTGGLVTIICDQFPHLKRWMVTTFVCLSLFLVGLIYVTPGGQFMVELVDHFGSNFVIYISVTIEVMALAWVYGLKNLLVDIEFMLNVKIGWYWKFCWGFFIPVSLTVILVYSLSVGERLTFNGWAYPDVAIGFGWTISAIALASLPIGAVHAVTSRKADGWMEKLKDSFRPTKHWGPRREADRVQWVAFKAEKAQEEEKK